MWEKRHWKSKQRNALQTSQLSLRLWPKVQVASRVLSVLILGVDILSLHFLPLVLFRFLLSFSLRPFPLFSEKLTLHIWDCSGSERFRPLVQQLYEETKVSENEQIRRANRHTEHNDSKAVTGWTWVRGVDNGSRSHTYACYLGMLPAGLPPIHHCACFAGCDLSLWYDEWCLLSRIIILA